MPAIDMLRNPDMWDRIAALARTKTNSASDGLRKALLDEDWEVRVYAAEGLARINQHEQE